MNRYILVFKNTYINTAKPIISQDGQSIITSSYIQDFRDYLGIGYYDPDRTITKIEDLSKGLNIRYANPFITIIPYAFWQHLTAQEQERLISALQKLNPKGIIPILTIEIGFLHKTILDGGSIYIIKVG